METQATVSNSVQNDNVNVQAKNRKVFPVEFRNQVIGVYKSGVYDSIPACAEAYGLSSKTLYRWLDEHQKSTTPSAISEHQVENANLKKELARAKMENEILKKAAIYFANQAR